tara:strand:- start:139 stop:654 length:516 start_codon:yes stop_codon:yes gene_type:complete
MKTIIEISNDYNSDFCYQTKVEDINYLVNELDVFCELRNTNYINIIEQEKRYNSEKEDYKNKIIVNAKGYSQYDWQDYVLYYNEKELKTPKDRMYFSNLVKHLEREFTHQNDYIVKKYEQTEIDGKIFNSEPYDYTCFYIDDIEFPNNEDIIKEYIGLYGEDFDKFIIENN